MPRTKLPNRRPTETFDFWYGSNRYHVSYLGYDGHLYEVFARGAKVGSETDSALASVTAMLSIALQHGVPLEEIDHTTSKLDDGSPADLFGAVIHECSKRINNQPG